jgi:very-short-patch-repair endonuclease
VFDVVASAGDRALACVILAQEGVVSRGQALRVLSPEAIRHRVASGRWRRAHTGIYLTFTGPSSRAQRHWIAVLAGGRSALLAGASALELSGLRGYQTPTIHLLLPATRTVTRPPIGVLIHRTRYLPPEDIARANQPPRTTRARSLIDAAQWAATEDDACAIVAAAYQQRIVNHQFVMAALDRLPNVPRRALIARTAVDAAGGSHSLAELNYLAMSRRAGLPEPTRQQVRRDAGGRRRYLDIWYDEYRVQVEIDGGQHLEVRAAWDDMKRQNDLWIAGIRVLRFPAWLVRSRPADVLAQVRAALNAGGWPG